MDITWSEAILSIGIGIGLAAATGMRVFLPLLVLGAAARLQWVPLAGGFEWLESGPGLAGLAVATVLEIVGYYVPWFDNALDLLAIPMAVIAGILATAAVTTEFPPALRWAVAIIGGGGTAGVVKSAASVVRLNSTALTAGFGNFILSTFELLGSLAASILAILAPIIALIAVGGLLFLLFWGKSRMLGGQTTLSPK